METKEKIHKLLRRKFGRLIGLDKKIYTAEKNYTINYTQNKKLSNKVAVVTGGSGAIGRACCILFASHGAHVYVGGRNISNMQKVVDEIRTLGGQADVLLIDVSDNESVESAFNGVKGIDILVNCAGGGAREKAKYLHLQEPSVVESVIQSNLIGSILCCRSAANQMVKQHSGKIINIASTIGVGGAKSCVDYSAAKAGIIGFTKSLAMELGEYDINVNCVSPGYIQRGDYNEITLDWLKDSNYMKKVGTIEDIANAVLFLASDESIFITGQNLIVDGGRSLGLKGAE